MDLYEYNTHPFVVKIWLEETDQEASSPTWRGHITHVPSGKRYHFRHLGEIALLIAPYLEEMGVSLGIFWKIQRWLSRPKRSKN